MQKADGGGEAAPATMSRALRTVCALLAGLTCGAAAAPGTPGVISERHALLTLIIPALYPIIEALADRIRGSAAKRRRRRNERSETPKG